MTRPALTTSDSPQKAESKSFNQKTKKSNESIETLKASVSGKSFKNLSSPEKDALLKALALQAGLIDPE